MSIEVTRLSPLMSSRKLQVLEFIRAYYARHGAGPSLREIAHGCHTTPPRVQAAIRKLAAEGRVHHVRGEARSVRPIDEISEALRQLAAVGYTLAPPATPATPADLDVIDLDERGQLIVTKASLPHGLPPVHDAILNKQDSGSGEKERTGAQGGQQRGQQQGRRG